MRRALFTIFLAYVPACGSSSTPDDPTALTKPLAQNVDITEIALLQVVKVPIMQGGAAADHSTIPIVAQRDAVVRVYVSPQAGFTPHALTARARIETTSPTGSFAAVFSATATVSGDTAENDLTTSINIPVPGSAIEMGSSITVVLNDESGDSATSTTSAAKWPQDGSAADLGVRDGGDRLRVMIVPVQYNADGSHRLPDTSDDQLTLYHDGFMRRYPTATVEITVHDPWPFSGAIDGGSFNGFNTLLNALQQLRSSDQPDPDIYYYAAVAPADSFGAYCGGGCTTGLSPIGAPYSTGIGFTGGESVETAEHEVGHAHQLNHAPCGGAGSPDLNYPNDTGLIDTWGYDSITPQMFDPTVYHDVMGYCPNVWISAYHFNKLFTRVRKDNQYFNDWHAGVGTPRSSRFVGATVAETGEVRVTGGALAEPWIQTGEPHVVRSGATTSTAYFFPYDHAPGGVVWMPESLSGDASVVGLRARESETRVVR